MTQITHEDFGFFQTELLQVDFITFNITKLFESHINQLTVFFQNLGFDCYLKKTDTSQSRQKVYNTNYSKNQFELDFILTVPYQKDMMQIAQARINFIS